MIKRTGEGDRKRGWGGGEVERGRDRKTELERGNEKR